MTQLTLADLGWSDHFARQCLADQYETGQCATDRHHPPRAARLSAIHRDRLEALSPEGVLRLVPKDNAGSYAVGDFVLHDGIQALTRLDRSTEIARRAAGSGAERQLIAANVDTLGIVTSCNADFNEARLERYIAVAESSGALPLVVLTKADMVGDPRAWARRAERLSPLVTALAVDARDAEDAGRLAPWAGPGQTLALTGSSGVGKTTLLNALTGLAEATRGIREDDARGRHTTTNRALRRALAGGWIIDTPGMRELQLTEASEGIEVVFADLIELVGQCRFSDCQHQSEPGCAVQAALQSGALDPARLARWDKLRREDRHNSETLAQARARNRSFAKMTKAAMRQKHGPGLKRR